MYKMDNKIVIAILFILYGLSRVILVLALLYLPFEKIQNIPILKNLIKNELDTTLAGKFYQYILFLFSLYAMIYGFTLLNALPSSINNFFTKKNTAFIINTVLYSAQVIFYALVLYTDVPIEKNLKDNRMIYLTIGLIYGVFSLFLPLIFIGLEYILLFFKILKYKLTNDLSIELIIGTIILIAILGDITYYIYKKYIKEYTQPYITQYLSPYINKLDLQNLNKLNLNQFTSNATITTSTSTITTPSTTPISNISSMYPIYNIEY